MLIQQETISHVGERLRSFRIGKGLTPDELAKQTGVSRAAIYRYEQGQPVRVDVLGKIADFLEVSLTTLLGVGSEYMDSAITFFERMRQIEAAADHIYVLFGPISYLLTTDAYDYTLKKVLRESVPQNAISQEQLDSDIEKIISILQSRKEAFRNRRPNIVSLVSSTELEQLAQIGFVGRQGLSGSVLKERRAVACAEIRHMMDVIKEPPIGVQVGVIEDSMPGTSFQLFRTGTYSQLAVSPFRLGVYSNIRVGVAMISSAQEAVQLHQQVTERLWKRSLKGEEAATRLSKVLKKWE